MKTNYLLPYKYKTIGWVLFVVAIIIGIFLFFSDYESDSLTIKVLSVHNDDAIFTEENGFF